MIITIIFLIGINIIAYATNITAGIITSGISLAILVGMGLKRSNNNQTGNTQPQRRFTPKVILSLLAIAILITGTIWGIISWTSSSNSTPTKEENTQKNNPAFNNLGVNPNFYYKHQLVFNQEINPGKVHAVCKIKKGQRFKVQNNTKNIWLKIDCLHDEPDCETDWALIEVNQKKKASKKEGILFVKGTEKTHLSIYVY